MENRRSDLEDFPRSRHACWAMPGAVAVIVLMILAFATPFGTARSNDTPSRAVALVGASERGVTIKAADLRTASKVP